MYKQPALHIALTAAIVLGMLGASFAARMEKTQRRDAMFGGLVSYIDRNVAANEPIGFTLCPYIYPLYGSRLDKRVVRVAANAASPEAWLDRLNSRGINLVAVGPVRHSGHGRVLSWIDQYPAHFQRITGTDPQEEIVLYRIVKESAGQ